MIRKIEINNYISEKGDNWNFILSYQLFGKPLGNSPVVLVNHSLTGNSNLTGQKGWWGSLVGKNKIIDLEKYTILIFNIPGNGYANELIQNYKDLVLRDIAKVFLIAIEKMSIKSLFAMIGGSIGGCLIWEMNALNPTICKNLIPIACDWKSNDWVKANTMVQNLILLNSKNPIYDARIHAMISYRTQKSFKIKFNRSKDLNSKSTQVESWLNHHGKKLNQRFSVQSYKLMNHLLSNVDITDGSEKKFKSLISRVEGNIYIISIKSDLLFTHSENRDTYNRILKFKKNVYLRTLISDHGHDSFLIEFDKMTNILSDIFKYKDHN